MLNKAVLTVQKYIIITLTVLMSLLLVLAAIHLGYMVITSIIQARSLILDMARLMELFGVFLLVLIGIELLDTIRVYLIRHAIHVEVVMLVAIIAVARKVILLDLEKTSGFEILGIGAIVIALTAGYYLIKKAGGCQFESNGDLAEPPSATQNPTPGREDHPTVDGPNSPSGPMRR